MILNFDIFQPNLTEFQYGWYMGHQVRDIKHPFWGYAACHPFRLHRDNNELSNKNILYQLVMLISVLALTFGNILALLSH